MLEHILTNAWELWAVISVICLILELGSGDLFLLSFAISAAATAILSLLGLNIYAQLVIFAVVSLLTLLLVRPSLLKLLHRGEDKRQSNAEALVRKTGFVTEAIPAQGYGRVSLGGDDWKAQSANGMAIAKGVQVKFVSRESIILTVETI